MMGILINLDFSLMFSKVYEFARQISSLHANTTFRLNPSISFRNDII